MKTISFVISEKENENRRAIVLEDLDLIKNKKYVYFETNYGNNLGYSDKEIIDKGFNVVSKKEAYSKEIIVDPKIGDSNYLSSLNNQCVFGWIHATQNKDITDKLVNNKLTAFAWEKMFNNNKHCFYKNNEIAGEAATLHAMILSGRTYDNLNVAILGNGNTSRGAQKIIKKFNANISIFDINDELSFRQKISTFDVIINCILWDVSRTDHIITKADLIKLKKNALIIDVSCDKNGGIETSIPTTIDNPIYTVSGIKHYSVDHTPSLLYIDSSNSISHEVVKYIDILIEEKQNTVLEACKIIESGKILDNEIIIHQKRNLTETNIK